MRKILGLMLTTLVAITAAQIIGVSAAKAADYTYSIDCNRQYSSLDATSPNTNVYVTLAPGDTVTFNQVQASGTNGFCTNLYTTLDLSSYFSTFPTAPMGNPITFVVKPGAAAVTNGRIAMYTLLIGGGASHGRQFYFTIAAPAPRVVTFNANSGTGSMATQSSSTAASLTSNSFTRTGYNFSGWNTAANGSGTSYANQATFPFTSNTTLFAQWTAIPRTVSFDANGGTGSMSAQGSSVSAALSQNAFTRSGYTFAGWNTAANGSGTAYANQATYSFTSNLTLYAQWTLITKSVTFDANGGSGSMAAQVGSSSTSLTANSFTRPGYTFSVWNTAANGSGTTYTDQAAYSFASDATLYAQWVAIPRTVTFNANGGVGSMTSHTSSAAASLFANAFTRSGYTFAGWNTSANGTGTSYVDQASFSFSSDQTLYAQWVAVPRILTLNGNGGSGSMSTQSSTVPSTISSNSFSRFGYTFAGWNTAADGSGTSYADQASFSFASDQTLFAQWAAVPKTVNFIANGGSGSMSSQLNASATSLIANAYSRSGYSFAGWNTLSDGSGTTFADQATYLFAANGNLYAQWTELPRTATFDANGGSGSMVSQSGTGSTQLNANGFTRSGYDFAGWNTAANGSGTAYADQSSYSFATNATLYAQWAPPPSFGSQQRQSESQTVLSDVKLNRVFVEGGSSPQVLVFQGMNFDKNFSASMGGVTLNAVNVSSTEMRFELPAGLYGSQVISLKNSANSFKFEGSASMGPRPGAPESAPTIRTLSNFVSGSAALTSRMKKTLSLMAKANAGATSMRCVGFTSGPTVLRTDRSLALARAQSVCQFLQSAMSPSVVFTLDAKADLRVTRDARRVSVEFAG